MLVSWWSIIIFFIFNHKNEPLPCHLVISVLTSILSVAVLKICRSVNVWAIRPREMYYVLWLHFIQYIVKKISHWPGVPTAIWHGFLSIFLLSSTGNPPMKTWQARLSICEPIEVITSFICTAISLVGARISTCSKLYYVPG